MHERPPLGTAHCLSQRGRRSQRSPRAGDPSYRRRPSLSVPVRLRDGGDDGAIYALQALGNLAFPGPKRLCASAQRGWRAHDAYQQRKHWLRLAISHTDIVPTSAMAQAQAVASIIVTSVLEEQSDGSGKLGAGSRRKRRLPRAEPVRRQSRSRRRRRRRMRASLVLRFEFCEPTAVGTGAVEPSTAFCAAHAASDAGTRLSRMS